MHDLLAPLKILIMLIMVNYFKTNKALFLSDLAVMLCVLSLLLFCIPARLTFNLTGLHFQGQGTVTPAGTSVSTATQPPVTRVRISNSLEVLSTPWI